MPRDTLVIRIKLFGVTLLLCSALADRASACALCIGFPEKTAADYLIESHCVILARPDQANSFAYAPRETLKGTFDGGEIDLLVDTVTRRVLQADSSCSTLLVQQNRGGDWRHLGVVSSDFEAVARRILLVAATWNGDEGRSARTQFFLPLFGHKQQRIRELAYLELGRSPYSVIRQLGRVADRTDYASILEQRQYIEWRSLAILLLAQSEDPQDKKRISESFRTAVRFGSTTNLAAWTAAAVEVEGTSAIDFIEENYFRHAARKPEELKAVMIALSMVGAEGDPELQNRIVRSYRELLRNAPTVAPHVAATLRLWDRVELTEELTNILTNGTELSLSDERLMRCYLYGTAKSKELRLVDD